MKIIFGFKFEAEDTLHRISEAFSNKGIDAELVQRNLKSSVKMVKKNKAIVSKPGHGSDYYGRVS